VLREGEGEAPLRRAAAHLVRGQGRVPQRHDRDRDEPPVARPRTPLVDDPVVVGAHARQAELLVGALGEGLAAKARQRVGEAHRRLDVVGVHIGEPVGLAPRPGPHLVEGDGPPSQLAEADGHRHAGDGLDQVVVVPDVGPLAVRAGHPRTVLAQLEVAAFAHEARPPVPQARRQPAGPQVRRLDDVVVDRDDAGDGAHPVTTEYVPRPDRSSAPAVVPVAEPSAIVSTPLTNTCATPTALDTSRPLPPGMSVATRGGAASTVVGSTTATSAHAPATSRPRSRSPNSRAGASVSSCTARSTVTRRRPRRVSARNRVGYGAPQLRSTWAPASEPPSRMSGSSHSLRRSAQSASVSLVGCGHSTVCSSSAAAISAMAVNGSVPRSRATSSTRRPVSPALAGANVSPIT